VTGKQEVIGIRTTTGFITSWMGIAVVIIWDEKAGLRDAIGSQVIGVLKAQEIKETGNEEG